MKEVTCERLDGVLVAAELRDPAVWVVVVSGPDNNRAVCYLASAAQVIHGMEVGDAVLHFSQAVQPPHHHCPGGVSLFANCGATPEEPTVRCYRSADLLDVSYPPTEAIVRELRTLSPQVHSEKSIECVPLKRP